LSGEKDKKKAEKEKKQQLEVAAKESETQEEVTELIEKIVESPRSAKQLFMAMSQSVVPMKTPAHLLFDKFTPEHIDKVIDHVNSSDKNEYELRCPSH